MQSRFSFRRLQAFTFLTQPAKFFVPLNKKVFFTKASYR
jgi:hypothetical protein